MIPAALRYLLPLGGMLLLSTLLAGCESLPASAPQLEPETYQQHLLDIEKIHSFELRGRIGVLTEKKGFSGLIRWHHHEDGDDIDLYSPLGTQLGKISSDAEGVTLTNSDQKTYRATSVETLTEQTIGWILPLSGLNDWALGRPTTSAVERMTWDSAGRLAHLHQDGWDIEFPQYMEINGQQLPAKITLKSTKLDLKLVVESWQTDAD